MRTCCFGLKTGGEICVFFSTLVMMNSSFALFRLLLNSCCALLSDDCDCGFTMVNIGLPKASGQSEFLSKGVFFVSSYTGRRTGCKTGVFPRLGF